MRRGVIPISYDYSTISDEDLENIKRRDKIKNDYCKEKNIPLVRITYREYSNIETKVKEAIDWIRQQNTQIESSLEKF